VLIHFCALVVAVLDVAHGSGVDAALRTVRALEVQMDQAFIDTWDEQRFTVKG